MPCLNESFPYPPLNPAMSEFRLLRVFPRDTAVCIRAEMFVSPLRKRTKYDALSYTWGTKPPSHTITVNGEDFWIRKGLYRFLWNFSGNLKQSTRIWIDGICIKQDSVVERNHQVTMMARIYSSAKSVHAWLGSFHDDPDLLWLLENIKDFSSTPSGQRWEPLAKDASRTSTIPDLNRLKETRERLSRCKYFSRAWIVQEIVLAKQVTICLEVSSEFLNYQYRTFSWELGALFTKYTLQDEPRTKHVPSFHDPWRYMQTEKEHFDSRERLPVAALHSLVTSYGQQRCSNPRDHMYSLLGLLQPMPRFYVDYGEHEMHLFLRVALLSQENSIDFVGDLVNVLELKNHLRHECNTCIEQQVTLFMEPRGRRGHPRSARKFYYMRPGSFHDVDNTDNITALHILSEESLPGIRATGYTAIKDYRISDELEATCLSAKHMLQSFEEIEFQRVVLLYALIFAMLLDADFRLESLGGTDVQVPGYQREPSLTIMANCRALVRWICAMQYVSSLRQIGNYSEVIFRMFEKNLTTVNQSKNCMRFARRVMKREREWSSEARSPSPCGNYTWY